MDGLSHIVSAVQPPPGNPPGAGGRLVGILVAHAPPDRGDSTFSFQEYVMPLTRSSPWRRCSMAVLVAAVAAVALLAAPVTPTTHETIKDRKEFIPNRQYQSLPGKVVGVLVSDVAAMMGQEGRGGPPDAMAFSSGGNSYRWVYVPV